MDIKRKEHIQNITQSLLILEKAIESDELMLENIKDQGTTPFVMAQIEKITLRNETRQKQILDLTMRRTNIIAGILDSELKTEILETNQKNLDARELSLAKKNKIKELKQAASLKSITFYKKTAAGDRENRYKEKDMKRTYTNYLKIVDTIPDYITKNLSEMPNNKGYLWRGIACYGELDDKNSNSTVLFERQRGGLLIIHERTQTDYKIFHKRGRDRKILFSSEKIRLKPTGFETRDLI